MKSENEAVFDKALRSNGVVPNVIDDLIGIVDWEVEKKGWLINRYKKIATSVGPGFGFRGMEIQVIDKDYFDLVKKIVGDAKRKSDSQYT